MARRGIPKGDINWFFPEWMKTLGVTKQVEIMDRTGWSKATVSQIMSGKQDYSPKIVNEASVAFGIAPYELLMKPDDAMALRRLRKEALTVVETSKQLEAVQPTPPASRKTGTDRP